MLHFRAGRQGCTLVDDLLRAASSTPLVLFAVIVPFTVTASSWFTRVMETGPVVLSTVATSTSATGLTVPTLMLRIASMLFSVVGS